MLKLSSKWIILSLIGLIFFHIDVSAFEGRTFTTYPHGTMVNEEKATLFWQDAEQEALLSYYSWSDYLPNRWTVARFVPTLTWLVGNAIKGHQDTLAYSLMSSSVTIETFFKAVSSPNFVMGLIIADLTGLAVTVGQYAQRIHQSPTASLYPISFPGAPLTAMFVQEVSNVGAQPKLTTLLRIMPIIESGDDSINVNSSADSVVQLSDFLKENNAFIDMVLDEQSIGSFSGQWQPLSRNITLFQSNNADTRLHIRAVRNNEEAMTEEVLKNGYFDMSTAPPFIEGLLTGSDKSFYHKNDYVSLLSSEMLTHIHAWLKVPSQWHDRTPIREDLLIPSPAFNKDHHEAFVNPKLQVDKLNGCMSLDIGDRTYRLPADLALSHSDTRCLFIASDEFVMKENPVQLINSRWSTSWLFADRTGKSTVRRLSPYLVHAGLKMTLFKPSFREEIVQRDVLHNHGSHENRMTSVVTDAFKNNERHYVRSNEGRRTVALPFITNNNGIDFLSVIGIVEVSKRSTIEESEWKPVYFNRNSGQSNNTIGIVEAAIGYSEGDSGGEESSSSDESDNEEDDSLVNQSAESEFSEATPSTIKTESDISDSSSKDLPEAEASNKLTEQSSDESESIHPILIQSSELSQFSDSKNSDTSGEKVVEKLTGSETKDTTEISDDEHIEPTPTQVPVTESKHEVVSDSVSDDSNPYLYNNKIQVLVESVSVSNIQEEIKQSSGEGNEPESIQSFESKSESELFHGNDIENEKASDSNSEDSSINVENLKTVKDSTKPAEDHKKIDAMEVVSSKQYLVGDEEPQVTSLKGSVSSAVVEVNSEPIRSTANQGEFETYAEIESQYVIIRDSISDGSDLINRITVLGNTAAAEEHEKIGVMEGTVSSERVLMSDEQPQAAAIEDSVGTVKKLSSDPISSTTGHEKPDSLSKVSVETGAENKLRTLSRKQKQKRIRDLGESTRYIKDHLVGMSSEDILSTLAHFLKRKYRSRTLFLRNPDTEWYKNDVPHKKIKTGKDHDDQEVCKLQKCLKQIIFQEEDDDWNASMSSFFDSISLHRNVPNEFIENILVVLAAHGALDPLSKDDGFKTTKSIRQLSTIDFKVDVSKETHALAKWLEDEIGKLDENEYDIYSKLINKISLKKSKSKITIEEGKFRRTRLNSIMFMIKHVSPWLEKAHEINSKYTESKFQAAGNEFERLSTDFNSASDLHRQAADHISLYESEIKPHLEKEIAKSVIELIENELKIQESIIKTYNNKIKEMEIKEEEDTYLSLQEHDLKEQSIENPFIFLRLVQQTAIQYPGIFVGWLITAQENKYENWTVTEIDNSYKALQAYFRKGDGHLILSAIPDAYEDIENFLPDISFQKLNTENSLSSLKDFLMTMDHDGFTQSDKEHPYLRYDMTVDSSAKNVQALRLVSEASMIFSAYKVTKQSVVHVHNHDQDLSSIDAIVTDISEENQEKNKKDHALLINIVGVGSELLKWIVPGFDTDPDSYLPVIMWKGDIQKSTLIFNSDLFQVRGDRQWTPSTLPQGSKIEPIVLPTAADRKPMPIPMSAQTPQ